MNPFWMTMLWTVVAGVTGASGDSEVRIMIAIALANLWGATIVLVDAIRSAPMQADRPSREVPRPVRSEAGGVPVSERESATLKDGANNGDSARTKQ